VLLSNNIEQMDSAFLAVSIQHFFLLSSAIFTFILVNFSRIFEHSTVYQISNIQGDHLSGKPGNIREFDSCQGNVRDFTENQGIVREKLPKTVYCKLHICVHTGI